MKVAELLQKRHVNWRELERLCAQLEVGRSHKLGSEALTRFATMYRSACADLALADAYQLPPETVNYLHQLVARAHNLLYRNRKFDFAAWLHELLFVVPQRMFQDNCLRLAFVLFWGVFVISAWMAYVSPAYSEQALGPAERAGLRESFTNSPGGGGINAGTGMSGFYVKHNATIGLRCFALGAVLLGIGGLFETLFNAYYLGAAFGYMATVPERSNFFNFVTAHGPFELTAIVLSAGAGMRVGFALIFTKGLSRADSWRLAARESVPTITAAVLLFAGAAFIEGFISPSPLFPYWFKALVAVVTSGLMMYYFVLLGWPREVRPPVAGGDPWSK